MQTFMIPGTVFMLLLAGALFGVFKVTPTLMNKNWGSDAVPDRSSLGFANKTNFPSHEVNQILVYA